MSCPTWSSKCCATNGLTCVPSKVMSPQPLTRVCDEAVSPAHAVAQLAAALHKEQRRRGHLHSMCVMSCKCV